MKILLRTNGKLGRKVKELIDENGPKYLTDEPYKVYKEIIRTKATDKKTGALLMFFVSGSMETVTPDDDFTNLSKRIQMESCFNKRMADTLTAIVLSLHSRENEEEWNNKDLEGLIRFRKNSNLNGKDFRPGESMAEVLIATIVLY